MSHSCFRFTVGVRCANVVVKKILDTTMHCLMFFLNSLSLFSDGITGTSLGARMLQGGVKKGLLLRNMQVE